MDLHESKHENNDDDVAQPGELLEDCWFFGNLLQTKAKSSRMLRSFSDPCSSSSSFPGKSYEEAYASIKKIDRAMTTTSTREKKSSRKISSSSSSSSSSKSNLVRAPSLPTSLQESNDFHDDEEIEFSMGKLIRQASLNYSDTRPPRRNNATNKSSSLTKQKSRRIKAPETESMKSEVKNSQLKTQRSLDIQQLQGFKSLGLNDLDEKSDLLNSPSNIVVVPAARPLSMSAPPVPRWGGKRSTEDMKAQIKFWARAVASNVRQEC